jgi:hypothetical protein
VSVGVCVCCERVSEEEESSLSKMEEEGRWMRS